MNQKFKNILQWTFVALSVILIGLFLYYSNGLVKSLGKEETEKMALWADAYQQLILADSESDMSMQWQVIRSNTTIPVFYTEMDGTLLGYKNIEIPFSYGYGRELTTEDTIAYLQSIIPHLVDNNSYFEINIQEDWKQYLYYDESILLQQLHYYPYVQVMAVLVLLLLFYYMLLSAKRYEQNRVWVGLSKETAHQLGTPIQSLMGWVELLKTSDSPQSNEVGMEMDKDVQRLRVVADRFSKIGSDPVLEKCDLRGVIQGVADYMQKRSSQNVNIMTDLPGQPVEAYISEPLFAWVIENLCKNAIDAQDKPKEHIQIVLRQEEHAVIEVTDDGKGIAKNKWKTIFLPGYTTKKRGWGLGLALVKRIVEEYHHGHIFVKSSTIGQGTTFRLEI
ncbi:MAG: HAMP domain-containing histidine kinase [Bacteroidales bacterium]|nr:HAMP domain-containing histidine kinase [Bacteroidales bacterium]